MPRVVYEFVATGVDEVRRAYRSVREEARRQREQGGMGGAGAAGGKGGTTPAAGPTPQVKAQVDAWRRAQEQGAKKAAQAQVKAYEEAERAAQKSATARENAARKAAQAEIKAAEDAKRRMAKIDAEMERRYERATEAKKRADARNRGRGMSGPGESMSGAVALGTMTANFVGGLANRAVNTVMGAARESMALQEQANRLSINARQAGGDFVDPKTLRREFEDVAKNVSGVKASDVADALSQFVSLTGELQTGRESASTFATVASATGSSVQDVSGAAASIFNQFGLKTNEEMKDVLASLTFQGKQGAFELRDAASQFQRLAAAGAAFGLSGSKGVKTIGGLAQIARTGTGSAEQTTTAIENIFSNLTAKSAILKREGVDVYDKKTGSAREVTEVLIEAIAKAGGTDFEKKSATLRQVFGDQGIRGILPLLNKFGVAFREAKGGGKGDADATAAGIRRLREEIDKAVNAPGSWEEVQKDAAQAQKDATAMLTASWERIKAASADKLLPALEKMIPTIEKLVMGEDGEGALPTTIEALADAMALAVDGVKEFTDSLYELGIISRKQKTPYEQQKEAEKKKAKLEKQLAAFDEDTEGRYKPGAKAVGPADPRMVAERERILAQIAGAEGEAQAAKAKVFGSGKPTVDLSTNEFVRKYMELGQNGGDASDWKGQAMYDERVRKMADAIEADPNKRVLGWDKYDSGDANEAQKALVRDYQLQQIQAKARPQEDVAAPGVDSLNAAAERAAAALNKVGAAGQPTIMGAPPG